MENTAATITEEARKEVNAYYREWRRKNPEKTEIYRAKYWAKRAAAKTADRKEER